MSLFGGVGLPGKPDLENVRKLDLLPLPMIAQMQRVGIAIDKSYFADLTSRLDREMEDLKLDICSVLPPAALQWFMDNDTATDDDDWSPFNINSTEQLAKLLFDLMDIGKGKKLKTTKAGNKLSTGKKQLETLKKEHPVIPLILQYRERMKLKTTYTVKLPRIARLHPKSECCPVCEMPHVDSTWRVHTTFTTTRTDTGRLASKEPNLQNIPARTELGRAVRRGFIAGKGRKLVNRDFSQIELRELADLADCPTMIQAFHDGVDIHTASAMRAFHKTREEVESKEGKLLYRAPVKNATFLIVYGGQGSTLLDTMTLSYAVAGMDVPAWLDLKWCEDTIERFLDMYPEVRAYMDNQHYRAKRYGFVWDRFGRVRFVPEVYSTLPRIRAAGFRQAGNMPIQGVSAGLLKLAMAHVQTWIDWVQLNVFPLLTVHDELVLECSEDDAGYTLDAAGYWMDQVLTDNGRLCGRVPIASDGHVMDRWEKD